MRSNDGRLVLDDRRSAAMHVVLESGEVLSRDELEKVLQLVEQADEDPRGFEEVVTWAVRSVTENRPNSTKAHSQG